MSDLEWLLTTAAEECMEMGQRVTKALRFGVHEVQKGQKLDNWKRIEQEYNDLEGTLKLLRLHHGLRLSRNPRQIDAKIKKLLKFKKLARKQGTLQGSPD